MSRKTSMIAPFAIALAILLYVITADHIEFYLVTVAVPGVSELRTRIVESATLWTGIWLAIGLGMALQRQKCFERGYTWMVGLAPLLLALFGIGIEFYKIRNSPKASTWLNIGVIVMPVLQCAFMAGLMVFLSHLWRSALSTLPNNLCKQCRYDLAGNTSGVCPECGKPIDRSKARI